MRAFVILAVLALLLPTAGCVGGNRVSAVEGKVKELEVKVKDLTTQVAKVEREASWDRAFKMLDSVAYLTPGSDGYSIVQFELGRVTVSLKNIEPYANGSRVTLRIGNPTSATLEAVKAILEWGKVDAKGMPLSESERQREVTFTRSVRPGAWTDVQAVLEGVPPVELGFVRVKELGCSRISLLKF